jgi:hypothetical protein
MAKSWQKSHFSIKVLLKVTPKRHKMLPWFEPFKFKESIVVAAVTLIAGMFLGALFMSLLVISRSDD